MLQRNKQKKGMIKKTMLFSRLTKILADNTQRASIDKNRLQENPHDWLISARILSDVRTNFLILIFIRLARCFVILFKDMRSIYFNY